MDPAQFNPTIYIYRFPDGAEASACEASFDIPMPEPLPSAGSRRSRIGCAARVTELYHRCVRDRMQRSRPRRPPRKRRRQRCCERGPRMRSSWPATLSTISVVHPPHRDRRPKRPRALRHSKTRYPAGRRGWSTPGEGKAWWCAAQFPLSAPATDRKGSSARPRGASRSRERGSRGAGRAPSSRKAKGKKPRAGGSSSRRPKTTAVGREQAPARRRPGRGPPGSRIDTPRGSPPHSCAS